MSFLNLFIFFACPKKTNQKKGQPIIRRFTAVPLSAEFPTQLKKDGRCGTRGVYAPQGCSNSPRAVSIFFCTAWLLDMALIR